MAGHPGRGLGSMIGAGVRGTFGWVLTGVWVGLGFQAKMIEAWAVLPVLAVVYLVVAPAAARTRWAHVARERLLDTIAHELGLDPVEVRRRNFVTTAEQPVANATGAIIDRIDAVRTLETVPEEVAYRTVLVTG